MALLWNRKYLKQLIIIISSIILLIMGLNLENDFTKQAIYLLATSTFFLGLGQSSNLILASLLLNVLGFVIFNKSAHETFYQISNFSVSSDLQWQKQSQKPLQLRIQLLEPQFRVTVDPKNKPPQILAVSKGRVKECNLLESFSNDFDESRLYFINYTMICDQMVSNTIYTIIKFEKERSGTSFFIQIIGFCCDSSHCLPVLSHKINCNHLLRNSFFSDYDFYKKTDLQVLSKREVLELDLVATYKQPQIEKSSCQNWKSYIPNPLDWYLKRNLVISDIETTLTDQEILNTTKTTTATLNSTDFSNETLNFGGFSNATLNDDLQFDLHLDKKIQKFVSLDNPSSVIKISNGLIQIATIRFWQVLMFCGLMLLFIIFCWIMFMVLIEFFSLEYS